MTDTMPVPAQRPRAEIAPRTPARRAVPAERNGDFADALAAANAPSHANARPTPSPDTPTNGGNTVGPNTPGTATPDGNTATPVPVEPASMDTPPSRPEDETSNHMHHHGAVPVIDEGPTDGTTSVAPVPAGAENLGPSAEDATDAGTLAGPTLQPPASEASGDAEAPRDARLPAQRSHVGTTPATASSARPEPAPTTLAPGTPDTSRLDDGAGNLRDGARSSIAGRTPGPQPGAAISVEAGNQPDVRAAGDVPAGVGSEGSGGLGAKAFATGAAEGPHAHGGATAAPAGAHAARHEPEGVATVGVTAPSPQTAVAQAGERASSPLRAGHGTERFRAGIADGAPPIETGADGQLASDSLPRGASGPQTAPTPSARPASPLAASTVDRLLDIARELEQAPPPRQLTVDVAEGRVRVRLDESGVMRLVPLTPNDALDRVLDDTQRSLSSRGFTFGDAPGERDEGSSGSPDDTDDHDQITAFPHRVRRERAPGVRL